MTSDQESAQERMEKCLPGVAGDIYGPTYRDDVLKIYLGYLESANRISERRQKANSFFLAVHTALIIFIAKTVSVDGENSDSGLGLLGAGTGAVLCYVWYRLIRSYRDLNSAKFGVIHVIERQLPLRPHDAEWECLGRGKDPTLYVPFTKVESAVPWLFMVFYGSVVALSVPWESAYSTLRDAVSAVCVG